LQKIKHLRSAKPASRHIQQGKKRIENSIFGADTAVSYREWDTEPFILRRTEHCLKIRGIGLYIGRHNKHVVRLQAAVIVEQIEKIIVKHLDFAHRAMARMDCHGRIAGRYIDPLPVVAALPGAPVDKVQNIALNAFQKRQPPPLDRRVIRPQFHHLRKRLLIHEDIEKIPAESSHRREQAVAGIEVQIARRRAAFRKFFDNPALLGRRSNIPPVMAGWIEKKKMQFAKTGHGAKHVDIRRRQRGYAEHKDAGRKLRTFGIRCVAGLFQKRLAHGGKMRILCTFGKPAPQLGLPPSFAAPFPIHNHCRAVHYILVEYVRYFTRKLPSPQKVAVVPQIEGQFLEKRFSHALRQQAHYSPRHHFTVKGVI